MRVVDGVKMSLGNIGGFINKNSPAILTGIGVVGVISTAISAVKDTPKALELLEEAKKESKDGFLTKKEVVKYTWKAYIPTSIIATITIASIVGANRIGLKRHTALVGAYSIAERALREYQNKVIETIGEKKEQSVRDSIAKDRIDSNPPSNNEVIVTGSGDLLCYDELSGRYFNSDIEKIRSVLNKLSRDLMQDMEITLNQVYYALGLEGIKLGDYMGWSIDDGLIEPDFSSHLTDDGKPCLVLDYMEPPKYIY